MENARSRDNVLTSIQIEELYERQKHLLWEYISVLNSTINKYEYKN